MAASVESPSPSPSHMNKNKETTSLMGSSSSPIFSPSSDKRFWSSLRSRIDTLLENRQSRVPSTTHVSVGDSDRAKRMKEDSLLLIRGFDSVAHTLSQLSNNLDNALQGARCLAEPPTLSEIFKTNLKNSEIEQEDLKRKGNDGEEDQEGEEEKNKGLKRKFDQTGESVEQECGSDKETGENLKDDKLKKAKNLAVSMATKAASLARELKSIRSDLCFMQERCSLLEEENRRFRDGFSQGTRLEEDDLMRLQMEALLGEKSRLANENANLTRENQCLHQLVEYHQMTSQDLSASYEQLIEGMCLDFSSPLPSPKEEAEDNSDDQRTPVPKLCFQEEQLNSI